MKQRCGTAIQKKKRALRSFIQDNKSETFRFFSSCCFFELRLQDGAHFFLYGIILFISTSISAMHVDAQSKSLMENDFNFFPLFLVFVSSKNHNVHRSTLSVSYKHIQIRKLSNGLWNGKSRKQREKSHCKKKNVLLQILCALVCHIDALSLGLSVIINKIILKYAQHTLLYEYTRTIYLNMFEYNVFQCFILFWFKIIVSLSTIGKRDADDTRH